MELPRTWWLLAAGALGPQAGRSPLVFETAEVDAGEVREGRPWTAEFRFKNDGEKPIRILDIVPCCGSFDEFSLEVEAKPFTLGEPIPARASGVVRGSHGTLGYRGDIARQFEVLSDDPSSPKTTLRMKAKVVPEFEFSAAQKIVDFGSVSNAEDAERTVELRNLFGEPFQIVGLDPPEPRIELSAEPADPTASKWTIRAKLLAGLPYGPLTRKVTVRTMPESAPVSFYLRAWVRGVLEIDPARAIRIDGNSSWPDQVRSIRIRHPRSSAAPHITSLRLVRMDGFHMEKGIIVLASGAIAEPLPSSVADHLEVSVLEFNESKESSVKITLKSSMPAGPYSAMLTFRTGVPDGPDEFAIPVSGFMRTPTPSIRGK